ncbi:pyrophosphatase PpaX [Thalassobacillus pellis]|uniref:pyrophosphatase PpaX n=1 Tax=Thalassobacillus pellis TaxID=748008 RepID=UPI00195FC713|nr:pyrophosphatase PpaX [Thalassobacillus pellis]MBM7551385.1 pyrophosphatase PpaX [Thalassobacillus pellis]
MNVNTILFDLDGTLIDTNELIIESFMHTTKEYGRRPYSRNEILTFIGPPLRDSMEKIDPEKVEELVNVYREHNISHHDDFVEAYPGVVETIQALREKGYRLGIVTTKMRQTVNMGLELTGLNGMFEVVVTLDDVVNAKPHPEPIEQAMAALNAEAAETLMVGDNTHDILAGKNAGTKTAGVAWTIKGREILDELNPDYMLLEMQDLLDILGG